MRVIGLMSGTSYDAIDAAVADFSIQDDVIRLTPGGAAHYPLPDGLDLRIAAMVKGEPVTAFDLCRLDTEVGQAFAEVAAQFIQDIAGTADLISSHGQTIYHWEVQGRAQGSLQIGNPAWIAERTGLPVVSDIRMRDIAAGGNGAASLVHATEVLPMQKTQSGVVQQVTVKTQSGVRTRLDMVGRDASGAIRCTECKASATAPLTKNQRLGFPEIQSGGGVVVGKGKPGFPGGTRIPPTKVEIIRL